MTDIIKTIGTGGDYADYNAADAAIPVDLVAVTQRWILRQISNISTGTLQNIGAHTTSSAYNIIIEAGVGLGWQDNAGKLTKPYAYDVTGGVALVSTCGGDVTMSVFSQYTEIRGVQIRSVAATSTGAIAINAANCQVHDNILRNESQTNYNLLNFSYVNSNYDGSNGLAYNNLIEDASTINTNSVNGISEVGTTGLVTYGNTIVSVAGSLGTGLIVPSGSTRDNLVFGFATAVSGSSATGSNNATDKATFAVGTSNLVSRVFATEFTASGDYRLKLAATSIGAGITISGRTTGALGQTLPNPPAIGAVEYITAAADTTAPTVSSAVVSNSTPTVVTLTMSEAMDTGSVPAASAFTVSGHTVSSVAIAGSTISLTCSAAFAYGEAARTVAYTQPGTNNARDLATSPNLLANFTARAITNNVGATDTTAPTLSSAQVANFAKSDIIITMSEALAASTPATSAFAVSGGRTVTGVAVSGSTVTVTVNTAYAYGDTITVTYTKPGSNMLKDAANNESSNFGPSSVTNNISASGSAGSFLTPPIVNNTADPTSGAFASSLQASQANWEACFHDRTTGTLIGAKIAGLSTNTLGKLSMSSVTGTAAGTNYRVDVYNTVSGLFGVYYLTAF